MKKWKVYLTERTTIIVEGKNKLSACMNSGYPANYFKNVKFELIKK